MFFSLILFLLIIKKKVLRFFFTILLLIPEQPFRFTFLPENKMKLETISYNYKLSLDKNTTINKIIKSYIYRSIQNFKYNCYKLHCLFIQLNINKHFY